MLETSETQILSQAVLQQNPSEAQICDTLALQPLVRAAPVAHSACVHGGLTHARLPATDRTSLTQMLSQAVLQQNASAAQICVTAGLQAAFSGPEASHSSWLHGSDSSTICRLQVPWRNPLEFWMVTSTLQS
jgi:hypothetical protein